MKQSIPLLTMEGPAPQTLTGSKADSRVDHRCLPISRDLNYECVELGTLTEENLLQMANLGKAVDSPLSAHSRLPVEYWARIGELKRDLKSAREQADARKVRYDTECGAQLAEIKRLVGEVESQRKQIEEFKKVKQPQGLVVYEAAQRIIGLEAEVSFLSKEADTQRKYAEVATQSLKEARAAHRKDSKEMVNGMLLLVRYEDAIKSAHLEAAKGVFCGDGLDKLKDLGRMAVFSLKLEESIREAHVKLGAGSGKGDPLLLMQDIVANAEEDARYRRDSEKLGKLHIVFDGQKIPLGTILERANSAMAIIADLRLAMRIPERSRREYCADCGELVFLQGGNWFHVLKGGHCHQARVHEGVTETKPQADHETP